VETVQEIGPEDPRLETETKAAKHRVKELTLEKLNDYEKTIDERKRATRKKS
tara:strand:+ start:1699 stop:1854 length:156 start_codon:yes stop_codon:yes gene_type:complete